MEKNIKIIAHRGLTLETPSIENSREAIASAILNPKVDGIEFDVKKTKDDQFVLMNYPTLADTTETGSQLSISDLNYDEIKKVTFHCHKENVKKTLARNAADFGSYSDTVIHYYKKLLTLKTKIARYDQTMENCLYGNKEIYVEIKEMFDSNEKQRNEFLVRFIEITDQFDLSNVTFIARDAQTLIALKNLRPTYKCIPLIGWNKIDSIYYDLDGYSIVLQLLNNPVPNTNKRAFEYILEKNKPLNVWTVDTLEEYLTVSNMTRGVENISITSNFPELIYEYKKIH